MQQVLKGECQYLFKTIFLLDTDIPMYRYTDIMGAIKEIIFSEVKNFGKDKLLIKIK